MVRYFATAVIRNKDGHYLVIHHHKKLEHPWRFAGGKIEEGETPIGALARELKEELNITPLSLRFIGMSEPVTVDSGTWAGYFFLCDSYEGEPTLMEPEKMDKMGWVGCAALLCLDSHPEFEMVSYLEDECTKLLS